MMDELLLLRGGNYIINDKLFIRQPTLDEIYQYGEQAYFSMISRLVLVPSDVKSMLSDIGEDYETVSDFKLFYSICTRLTKQQTSIIFGDNVDLSKMKIHFNTKIDEYVLCEIDEVGAPKIDGLVIDSYIYELVVSYVRKMHGFQKKVEHAYNDMTKRILIEEDRQAQMKAKEYKSMLKPLILSLVNCADFPYNFATIWDVPISTFLESVGQIQKYKNVGYLMQGIYSGTLDSTKIKKDELIWI